MGLNVKTLLHVDMDAFFASVELLSHPEWRGKPVIVGARPNERGVVSTCSYEARKYGVRSAMPSRTAYQLCPHAIFTPPHMELYSEISNRVFKVFESFTPYVEGVSIDEAFLDVTGALHRYALGSVESRRMAIGQALSEAVFKEAGVTCSVGIAPNRLLAKIGSEQKKPNGITLMPFDQEEAARFLALKPVSVLWGVGKKTVDTLASYAIYTCRDVQSTSEEKLATILHSPAAAMMLRRYSFGICDDTVRIDAADEKSVSREHTFDFDVTEHSAVREKLLELVVEVGQRLREKRRWAKVAKIKLRDASFQTITRQIQFSNPSRDDIALRSAALKLFDDVFSPSSAMARSNCAFRLIGFGVSNFTSSPDDGQQTLIESEADKQRLKRERLSDALDSLRAKDLL